MDGSARGRRSTILLAESERDIALPLGRALEREGYDVTWVARGREVFDAVEGAVVACVVLDLSLPDMDGVDVCRGLRESGYEGGVVMVTARVDELDCVVGLDSGADDYLRKPFALAELLARLRAVLRRTGPGEPEAVPETPLRLDIEGRRAYARGTELQLTNKEFGVLTFLDAHRDKVVPRGRLMSEVWDENWYGSTKTLDVTIGRLRSKLEAADLPDRIVAVRGVGFRLEHTHQVD